MVWYNMAWHLALLLLLALLLCEASLGPLLAFLEMHMSMSISVMSTHQAHTQRQLLPGCTSARRFAGPAPPSRTA